MQWLVVSVVLSVVLTIVLNVAVRAYPRAGERIGEKLADLVEPPDDRLSVARSGGVYVPWKAMIVVSLLLTVGLNLALWVLR